MFSLSDLLKGRGHEVVPFAMKDARNALTEWNQYFVSAVETEKMSFGWQGLRTAGRFIYSFEAVRKFRELVGRGKPDLLHIHNLYHQISPSILPVAKEMGVPVVMTAHDFALVAPNYSLFHDGAICEHTKPDRYWQAVSHRCVRGSRLAGMLEAVEMGFQKWRGLWLPNIDRIVAPAKFVADTLIAYGVPAEKIVVVPHFVTAPVVEEVVWDEGEYMLYVGRLVAEKGVDVLVRAAARVPEIPVHIVGVGPDEERLRRLADSVGARNVVFRGFLEGAALTREYARATALVVPSVWYEVFGLICLEAAAQGKPVIASKIGSLPEVVLDGETGLLFPAGDADVLAGHMMTLWREPRFAEALGVRGWKRVKDEFGAEKHYERLMGVYSGVMKH